MAKQNQATEAKNNKKNLLKYEAIVAPEADSETGALSKLPAGLVAAAGDSTIQAQAARLGDEQLKGAQRRALASHIGRVQGNRHLQRVVASLKQNKQTMTSLQARPIQRVGKASNVAGAVKLAPKGPLAKLQDELDDVFVDESACLKYIGQLGPGERELVRKDSTMMRQMARAFNAREILTAVELLDFKLKKSIYWINKAGEADDIGNAGYARLIGSASSQEVAEMIGWKDVRRIVQQNYKVNPLSFPPLARDDAKMHHVIGAYVSFSDWVLEQAGARAYLRYAGSHDPATTMAKLKTVKRWNTLLSALPRGQPAPVEDRPALFKLFKAAIAASDKTSSRRLFEIRFDRRYPGDFDWVAKGEERWTSEDKLLGEKTETQIKADIKAGKGPKSIAEAVKASPKGALDKLRNELDDVFVDESACLGYLGQLTAQERYLVRQDKTMMSQMARAFNAREMSKALNFIQFPRIGKTVEWLRQAGVHDEIGKQGYGLFINNATSQQVAELIGWRNMFNIVKEHSGLNPLALSPLVGDDAKMAHVIKTYPYFSDWVLKYPGAQMYLRYLAMHSPKQTAPALKHAKKLPDLLQGLPTGSALTPDDQKAMYTLFTTYTDLSDKKSLMKKRFNLQDITKEDAAAPAWDAKGLKRVWQLLERLPPALASDNKWLKRLTRTKVSVGSHEGVTGGDRVGIGYTTAKMGKPESGGFADPGDKKSGTNIFDGVVLHEMGHAADNERNFSRLSGPIGTRADLGQWKQYTDMSKLYAALAAGTNLSALGLKKAELKDTKTALVKALTERKVNPEDAFKGLAAAWTPANKWHKLWNKVKGHAIVNAIQQGHRSKDPWHKLPAAVGGRYYHEGYPRKWASYLTGARAAGKLSRYQFRNHREFFAEMYAMYYLTPNDPGSLVKKWNVGAYRWFRETVDAGFTTRAKK